MSHGVLAAGNQHLVPQPQTNARTVQEERDLGMEYIKEIKELDRTTGMDGFMVVTSEQKITLGISNRIKCDEQWGHFWCNDDVSEFIGERVIGVTLTNEALNSRKVAMQMPYYGIDLGGFMFVNIETDRGILQFVCYNSHDGFCGHTATVMCNQLNHNKYI